MPAEETNTAALEGVGVVQDLGSVVSRVREPVVEELIKIDGFDGVVAD